MHQVENKVVKEKDIRPKKLFKKFLHLSQLDIKKYFKKFGSKINCIACNRKGNFSFKKNNFTYCLCPNCKTLFVNPRPSEKAFSEYYTKSASIKFFATNYYKKTKKNRTNKIWKPKAKMIYEIIKKYKIKNTNFIDIGGGYGIFAKEISKLVKSNVVVIEPSPFLAAECRKKKLKVVEKFLENVQEEDLPNGKKVFTSFELLEHLVNPSKFIKNTRKLMKKNDLLILSTLSSTGADILTLWDKSKSVSPPHHINFFNPKSISIFLKKYKFKIINISTPGKLDINILDNNKILIKDRFWRTFADLASESEKSKMQNLISNINFSSHMMVICKK